MAETKLSKAKQLAVLRQRQFGEDRSRRLKLVDKQAEGVPATVHEITPARYDQMCHAIETAYKFDDLKEIRDKAKLLEAASRIAGNVKNEELAAKIRLRAE